MKKINDAIEVLEEIADEMAGAGDYINADNLSEIIQLLDDLNQRDVPKIVIDEGDHYRCPSCGKSLGYKIGRCYECGQRIGS